MIIMIIVIIIIVIIIIIIGLGQDFGCGLSGYRGRLPESKTSKP